MPPLKHFLVVYRRSTAELQDCQDLGLDRHLALQARFEREQVERHDADIEVVLLSASSKAELEKTHARYFRNSKQLSQSLVSNTSGTGYGDI